MILHAVDYTPDTTARVNAALDCARRGRPVLPIHTPDDNGVCSCRDGAACTRPGKHPRIKTGRDHCRASTDPAVIRRWWHWWPDANVGIVTGPRSKLAVIDVDGEKGAATLAALEADHGPLPATATSRTGKGIQLLFQHPGFKVTSRAHSLGPCLDVRGDGGFIVVAPSLHYSGREYEWIDQRDPAPMPGWLLDQLAMADAARAARPSRPESAARVDRPYVDSACDGHRMAPAKRASLWLAKVPGAISGQEGHDATMSAAIALVRGFCLPAHEALALLRDEFNPRCVPPWSERELQHKIDSAVAYTGPGEVGRLLNAPLLHPCRRRSTGQPTRAPAGQPGQPRGRQPRYRAARRHEAAVARAAQKAAATAQRAALRLCPPPLPEGVISKTEACQIAGRTERTIRRWIANGSLTDLRPAGDRASALLISLAELQARMAASRDACPPPCGNGATQPLAAAPPEAPAPPAADPQPAPVAAGPDGGVDIPGAAPQAVPLAHPARTSHARIMHACSITRTPAPCGRAGVGNGRLDYPKAPLAPSPGHPVFPERTTGGVARSVLRLVTLLPAAIVEAPAPAASAAPSAPARRLGGYDAPVYVSPWSRQHPAPVGYPWPESTPLAERWEEPAPWIRPLWPARRRRSW